MNLGLLLQCPLGAFSSWSYHVVKTWVELSEAMVLLQGKLPCIVQPLPASLDQARLVGSGVCCLVLVHGCVDSPYF